MTKEIKNWYDRTDMKKLALKCTTSNWTIVDPPDHFESSEIRLDLEYGNIISDMWVAVESAAASLGDEVVPAVLEFQADP
jgi:hypothetical protein